MRRFAFPVRYLATLAALAVAVITLDGAAPAGSWTFPTIEKTWFGTAGDLDGDGVEELVMPSVARDAATWPTAEKTQIHVLSVNGDVLTERTQELFGGTPMSWSIRNTIIGDFNGDGRRDIFFCGAGHETALSFKTTPPTPGIWVEQSQIWIADGGRLFDRTALLPQVLAHSHGCSAGDLTRIGRDAIVLSSIGGPFAPYPSTFVETWDGTRFVATQPFPAFTGTRLGKAWGFVTATGDFDRNGYADVVGDQDVLWGGAAGPTSAKLAASHIETDTFGGWQGQVVADLTGDGYPDLVKILSTRPSELKFARFVLYKGGPQASLTEKVDAFPAIETYGETQFGLDATVIDINFDGFPDLAVFGPSYDYGTSNRTSPDAVWLNDGTGRFRLARFTDTLVSSSVCNGNRGGFRTSYFLKSGAPNAYNVIAEICGAGIPEGTLVTRRVTPDKPLTFLP